MNEQRSTWSAGKMTILIGFAIAFIAMFLPWWAVSHKIEDPTADYMADVIEDMKKNPFLKGNPYVEKAPPIPTYYYTEFINGWGYTEGRWFPNKDAAEIGFFGIFFLILLLVPLFCVIAKREKDLKSKKIFFFPILPFILSLLLITKEKGGEIGNILFFLSTVAVTAGIVLYRRDISIGTLLDKFKGVTTTNNGG